MNNRKSKKEPKPIIEGWITHKEARELLQCGKVKYFELIKYKQINSIRFANKAFVERASVELFISTHNLKYNKARSKYLEEVNSNVRE